MNNQIKDTEERRMTDMTSHRKFFLRIGFLGVGLILFLSVVYQARGMGILNKNRSNNQNDEGTGQIYLPILFNGSQQTAVFGVEFRGIADWDGLAQMNPVGLYWVRRNGVIWSEVSPNSPSERNWQAMSDLENELINASINDLETILIIRSTPPWAQLTPGFTCSAIKQSNLQDFADFVRDTVERYSVSPFNIKYWEIWNEPDVDPTEGVPDEGYGCWGNKNDPYYGGGYFAEMLRLIYPVIKSVDPTAQVLVGGLLLDCDPRLDSNCISSKFFEGILRNSGGAYFDGVSFHAYDYYPAMSNSIGRYLNVNWKTAWNTTGPVFISKAEYLQSLLDDPVIGASGKYLVNTESALICDTCNQNNNYETTKAYYVSQDYAAAIASNLKGNIWFTVTGWRNSGLLWSNLQPRPAYYALSFVRKELDEVRFSDRLAFNLDPDQESDVIGYEFDRGYSKIWLIWSLDGNSHSISLPFTPSVIYDTFGVSQPVSGNSVNVTIQPVYLEWNP